MKLKLTLLALLTTVAAIAADTAATPGILFNAVLTSGKTRMFGVSTPGTAKTAWLPIGGEFQGYTIKNFNEPEQTLIVEKAGKQEKVKLATASIKEADTKATLADAQAVIDQMHFEDLMTKMVEQQKKGTMEMMKKMAGGRDLGPEQQAFQAKLMDVMMSAMDPAEMKKDMTRIYAEVFTKDELHSLGEFYGTPAGQSFIAKQPEAQQKLQEVIFPRMMKVMPQIQQMSRDFAKEQMDKRQAEADAAKAATPAPAPEPAK
jgi:hypothetical protein